MHKLKVTKLDPNAIIPTQANNTDAGHDVYALDDGEFLLGTAEAGYPPLVGHARIPYVQYRTGIAVEPPAGYHVELFPRSSVSKTDLVLANSIGLIDEGFRGEILLRFKIVPLVNKPLNLSDVEFDELDEYLRKNCNLYGRGDRIGQLVLRKTEHYKIEEVETLSTTERGEGGFGSSGK
ncbi:MAG: hypothetical protein HC888_01775 [Candidatus Competibacteraceae bacterium]|nr:hypothetical protein [Candidatus Competibacteraceae bacterium]